MIHKLQDVSTLSRMVGFGNPEAHSKRLRYMVKMAAVASTVKRMADDATDNPDWAESPNAVY